MEKDYAETCIRLRLNPDIYNKFKDIDLIKRVKLSEFVNYCIERFVNDSNFQSEAAQHIINKKISAKTAKKMGLNFDVDLNTSKKI